MTAEVDARALMLETARLRLRPVSEADGDLCVALSTDPEVMRYVGELESEVEARASLSDLSRRSPDGVVGVWAVCDRRTGEAFGTVFLLPLPVEEDDTPWEAVDGPTLASYQLELGFLMRRAVWGRGLASEAAARLVRFAFEQAGLAELTAVIDPENLASKRVLEKVGFTAVGLIPAYGAACPAFRMTAADWAGLNRDEEGGGHAGSA